MWFFMISCYVLSAVTFAMLLSLLTVSSLVFLILTSMVYCFTETLVIFFFVGTGVSVRDYSKDNNLPESFRKRSLAIKYKIYPPTMLNLLFMIVLFILPGAVHAGKIPMAAYSIYLVFCLGHYVYTKLIQHDCFRANTENILAMSGIARAV